MDKEIIIDLNSDIGESFGIYKLGLDDEIIPHISSANIACGFHGGDPSVMRKTVLLAKKYGVEIGAHPGFPDLLGFGRRNLDATIEEIYDYIIYQVGALQAFAKTEGLKLQHLKPHGALYNMAVSNPKIWEVMGEVILKLDKDIILVVLASSNNEVLIEIGRRLNIRIAFEAFPDRAYNRDGTLVSRREKGAVIYDYELVARRALKMAMEGKVETIDGTEVEIRVDTLCVHGDNPQAVQMVKKIREVLSHHNVKILPMKHFIRI